MALWATILGFYKVVPNWLKKLVGTGLILLLVFYAGDIRGRRIEHAKCEAAAAAAKTAADAQDNQAGREIAAQDVQVTEELKRQKQADDATITDLKARLRSQSTAPCVYDEHNSDAAPARRMRH